jgi:hypothetical protein
VLRCARDAGYIVVGNCHELRHRFEADEAAFWPMWIRLPNDEGIWHTSHLSAAGNEVMAELLADAIRRQKPGIFAQQGNEPIIRPGAASRPDVVIVP